MADPATATAPVPIQFHAWADGKRPQINPMSWITGAHEPAQLVAAGAARQLLARPPERRVLLIVPALLGVWAGDQVRMVAQGPNTAAHLRWFTSFYEELARKGIRPAFIATDEEFGFNTFGLMDHAKTVEERVAIMRRFYDDPGARAKMPPEVAKLTPEDFSKPGFFVPSVDSPQNTWNRWATQVIFKLIDDTVFAPARKVWPGFDRFSNYADVRLAYPVVDHNGWPVYPVETGGHSSPSLYLLHGIAHNQRKKHRHWNVLIGMLNLARSSIMTDKPVMPWVSYPAYAAPNKDARSMQWLWSRKMEHLLASGVREFLYWNPAPDTSHADNALVADVVDNRRPAARRPDDLPLIAWDADQITTGETTTTYEQFTANFKA